MKHETISLRSLTIGYKTKQGVRTVASDINAAISSGELTCLLGQNGIGKSTLLRTLSGFLPPLGGEMLIGGQPLSAFTPRELAQTVGVVLTDRLDMQQMSVSELVSLGRQPYTGFFGMLSEADRYIVAQAMKMVGIAHLAQRLSSTLSDGERQKTMIAKALAQQTPLLWVSATACGVLHGDGDLELALQTADLLWLMQPGGELAMGTPQQMAREEALKCFIEQGGKTRFDASTMQVVVKN